MPGLGHDQVVVQHNAELAAGVLDLFGHIDIGLGRGRIAGRVVVDHDDRRRAQFQRPLDHFAGIDRGVVDGAGKLVLSLGSPGGSNIIGYVAKTIIAALDWDMDIQAAVDLPHFINRNGATTDLEKGTAIVALKSSLEAAGHLKGRNFRKQKKQRWTPLAT